MPIYAYRCSKCGDETEVVQSMSAAQPKRCKKCRSALQRVYHPVGIVLKGSGFYKTDNRRGSKTSEEKKSGTDSKSESKSDTKSESKSKSESKPASSSSD